MYVFYTPYSETSARINLYLRFTYLILLCHTHSLWYNLWENRNTYFVLESSVDQFIITTTTTKKKECIPRNTSVAPSHGIWGKFSQNLLCCAHVFIYITSKQARSNSNRSIWTKTLWKRYTSQYISSCGLNSITIVLLHVLFWN